MSYSSPYVLIFLIRFRFRYSLTKVTAAIFKVNCIRIPVYPLTCSINLTLSDDTQALDEFGTMAINSDVSPLLAEVELLAALPPTKIYVSEHDVLKDDGLLMYSRLRSFQLNYSAFCLV